MSLQSAIKDVQPWYRERWPWLLMAGPAIVIVAGFTTAWLAIKSNDGLVEDDYYKQGLAVNQRMHRDHVAAELNVKADVMRSGLQVRVMVTAKEGAKLPDRMALKVSHPTRAGNDQLVNLESEGHGFYSGTLSRDITGRWLVTLEEPSGQWRLQGEWQSGNAEPLRLSSGE